MNSWWSDFRFCLLASIPLKAWKGREFSGLGGTLETAELAARFSRVPESRKGGRPHSTRMCIIVGLHRPVLSCAGRVWREAP